MKEEWKYINGYSGFYQVSNLGNVRSWRNGSYGKRNEPQLISPRKDSQGYRKVALYNDGNRTDFKISRLVAEYFIPNPTNKPEVNHIDGIKSNDSVRNLEWVTPKENVAHAFETGLNKVKSGEDSPNARLTDDDIRWIRAYYDNDEYNQVELAEIFDTSQSHISRIVRRETRTHFDKGIVIDSTTL